MTDLIEEEQQKLAEEFAKARDKWAAENPEIAEWAKAMGLQLAAKQNAITQLLKEMERLTCLFGTAIRLGGGFKMAPNDLFETYEAISQKKNHIARVGAPGGEVRFLWKHGPAPRSEVVPLTKKEPDLTESES